MDKIYEKANDQGVATYIVYANAEKAIFYDAACTKAVPNSAGLHLFANGVVALYSGSYYKAVSCTTAGVIDFGL